MDRPPYSLSDENKDSKALYTGTCFCEKVKYEIFRDKPLDAKFCHCPTCQKLHGAPFQWVCEPWGVEETAMASGMSEGSPVTLLANVRGRVMG
jgi:hypothetical protein